MVYFETKNPNFGNFWRALVRENFAICYGHSEYLTGFWDIV
jgi:hypothetical protein